MSSSLDIAMECYGCLRMGPTHESAKRMKFQEAHDSTHMAYGATPDQSKRVVKPDSVATQRLRAGKITGFDRSSLFKHVQIFAAVPEENLQRLQLMSWSS